MIVDENLKSLATSLHVYHAYTIVRDEGLYSFLVVVVMV